MSDTLALIEANTLGLSQIQYFLEKIDDQTYRSSSNWLTGSSPGAHIRHTLEFYSCLLNTLNTGIINYDHRVRNLELEHNKTLAQTVVNSIRDHLFELKEDKPVSLETYDLSGNLIIIPSSLHRELIYTLEHLIHHLALLRVFMCIAHPGIELPENFGVANSTLNYRNQQCAQ